MADAAGADSTIRRIADYATGLSFADLPADAVHACKRRIADTLACGIAGFDAEPSRNVGHAKGAIGFQEDLENASGQRPEQMGAGAALIAHDDLVIPLAPSDRVRGNAAPAERGW